jgi:5'-nucleotidase / UDP-sugar diphosphatase
MRGHAGASSARYHRLVRNGAAALLGALLAGLAAAAQAQNAQLTLLHINDVYEISPVKGQGGLAELMTLLRRERDGHQHTLTTVGGDFLAPSILSGLTKGAQMVDLFNAIGVDVVGFGNHEFDFGPEVLRQRIAEGHFAWVSSNVTDSSGEPLRGTVTTLIKEVEDVRIGFLGLVTPHTAMLSSGGAEMHFAEPIAAARAATAELKKAGANVVIALTHLEIEQDLALANDVKGIDVILGGHDHEPITYYEHGVLIHKSGSDAHFLGAIDLDIRTVAQGDKKVTTVQPAWRMLANTGVPPDPAVAATVKLWTDRLGAELDKPVGKSEVELDSRAEFLRSRETGMGDLVADALRDGLGADVALVNGGGIRGNRLREAGATLTRKDVLAELPFGNLAIVVELGGADLLAALENGVGKVEEKAGRFPQVSGMRVVFDPKGEPGHRVRSVTIAGKPLDPAARYKVATLDFLYGGGDGYAVLAKGKNLTDMRFASLAATTVMDYIQRQGTVAPKPDGRIAPAP